MTKTRVRRLQSWQQLRTVDGIEQRVPLGPRGKRLVDRQVATGARAAFAVALSAVALLDETFRWLMAPLGRDEGWRRIDWPDFLELAEALRDLRRVSSRVGWLEFDAVGVPMVVPLCRTRLPVHGSKSVASAHDAVLAVLHDAAGRVEAAMHNAGCLRSGESQPVAVARLGAAGWNALSVALVELVDWAQDAAPLQWPSWTGIEEVLAAELRKLDARSRVEANGSTGAKLRPPAAAKHWHQLGPDEVRATDIVDGAGGKVPGATISGWVNQGLKLDGREKPERLKVLRKLHGGERVFRKEQVERFVLHSAEVKRNRSRVPLPHRPESG